MTSKLLTSALLFLSCNVCLGSDWRDEVGLRLDSLVSQLKDGCSGEVKEARRLYQFEAAEERMSVALISIEGQHCGNGNVEYLAIYRVGYGRPKDENDVPPETYWLSGLAVVGGRGERMVDFDSLKYSKGVFIMNALGYNHDAMCCPSRPIVLRYKFSFYGLNELQPTHR